MHYAVISDVHSNLEALEAVLKDIKKRRIGEIIFLGDAVGYGPNPNECIEILKDNCKFFLAGNHDWASIGLTDIEYFNEYARMSILWTRSVLKEENRKVLEKFNLTMEIKKENIFLVHSTPKETDAWNYLLTLWDAEVNFHCFSQRICILGHSHRPFVIERLPSGEMVTYRNKSRLGKSERYIINAGSLGQPRDRDPRACYAVLSDDGVEFVRVEYNIEETQRKMRNAGLPSHLIERLASGT